MSLNQTQSTALKLAQDGHNFVLYGGPGTGKSYTVGKIVNSLRSKGRTVALTCSTGIACSVYEASLQIKGRRMVKLGTCNMHAARKVQTGVVVTIVLVAGFYCAINQLLKPGPIMNPQALPAGMSGHRNQDDTLLVPSDRDLRTMDMDQLIDLWWSYIHTVQVLCRNQMRLGVLKDGGKEFCIDKEYKPTPSNCLVYSIGSAMMFDFEDAVTAMFNCEIHTFDPSVGSTKEDQKKIPKTISYHLLGLDSYSGQNKHGWKVMTFSNMLQTFGHQNATLDILKMDIEHSEWTVIPEMIRSGAHKQVKQLLLEIHFWLYTLDDTRTALSVLRLLYESGFRIFMRERNIFGCVSKHRKKGITVCNELSFINICFREKC